MFEKIGSIIRNGKLYSGGAMTSRKVTHKDWTVEQELNKHGDEIAELKEKETQHIKEDFVVENGLVVLGQRLKNNEIESAVGTNVLCIPFRYSGNRQWYIKCLQWNETTPSQIENGTYNITIYYK